MWSRRVWSEGKLEILVAIIKTRMRWRNTEKNMDIDLVEESIRNMEVKGETLMEKWKDCKEFVRKVAAMM